MLRRSTIELVIEGRVDVWADGQLDLPKQPPFHVLTPGWAALVTVQLDEHSPDRVRLFDHWWLRGWTLDVLAFDGVRTAIRAGMQCVEIVKEQGIQATRSWTEPLRRATVRGQSALYRPQPRFQRISRDVHRYTLAAQRYALVAPQALHSGILEHTVQ